MVFDTLRVGFPTATVTVVDNASHPATVAQIEAAAASVEAGLERLANRIEHGTFINMVLAREESGPIVFLDTDIVFWESCEDMAFQDGTLMAGRLTPKIGTETAVHSERIHPSFLWVPDRECLQATLMSIAGASPYFRGFEGYSTREDGRYVTLDTGSAVYGYISDRCEPFPPEYLDRYDHLFMGTLPDQLDYHGLPDGVVDIIREGHSLVATPGKLRGIWRKQQGRNIEWNYLAGRLRVGGKEYGIFVARFHDLFHDERWAHAAVTNHTDGMTAAGPATIESDTEVRAPWGSIDLRPMGASDSYVPPLRRYGATGWTDVYTSPDVPTLCHLRLNGQPDIIGLGEFWYDNEVGMIPPGAGWKWAGIRLDDGRSYVIRTEFGKTEAYGHVTANGGPSPMTGFFTEDGVNLAGMVLTFSGPPVPTSITDPARGLAYTETYNVVFDEAGRKVGFAFVEEVPYGNGTPQAAPPPRDMFLRWAGGDAHAAACVATLWRASQIADDLADDDTPDGLKSPALMDLMLTAAVTLNSNPFYSANREYLEPVITSALLFWDASNAWAVSNRRDTQIFGYAYREAFSQVIVAVAYRVGGMEFARNVLRELHCYFHDTGRVESFDAWRKEQADGRPS